MNQKITYLFLMVCLLLPLYFEAQPISKKEAKKKEKELKLREKLHAQKGQYQRYEFDDMHDVRQDFAFGMPAVSLPEDTFIEYNTFAKVEKFFKKDSVRMHIEANPKVAKLLAKQKVEPTKKVIAASNSGPKSVIVRIPLEIKGYRVQIYTGPDRNEALNMQKKFSGAFPEVARYLVYNEPNYRVQVGDFATQTDANDFCRKAKHVSGFEGAFVIRATIKNPAVPAKAQE
jgi:hypothetical protein